MVGVVVAGRPRAYPWWIVKNYHVVNDTVLVLEEGVAKGDRWVDAVRVPGPGDYAVDPYVPLLVTLCEACSGASAYVPAPDGSVDRPLVFAQCRVEAGAPDRYTAVGTYTICDLQTQSRWHPFTGRAESGPLAGQRLQRVPVFIEHWKDWRQRHPGTQVVFAGPGLRNRTLARSRDSMGGPGTHTTYKQALRANPEREDKRLASNEVVLGIATPDGSRALAYPLSVLSAAGGLVQRDFAGRPVLLVLRDGWRAAAFYAEVGGEMLGFQRGAGEAFVLEDESGGVWNELGEAESGPHKGRSLELIEDSYVSEWGEWAMQHPGAELATP